YLRHRKSWILNAAIEFFCSLPPLEMDDSCFCAYSMLHWVGKENGALCSLSMLAALERFSRIQC
ncbi:hypothetical protein ACFL6S_26780, partial [Candidatus Poribacteria bacterium]